MSLTEERRHRKKEIKKKESKWRDRRKERITFSWSRWSWR